MKSNLMNVEIIRGQLDSQTPRHELRRVLRNYLERQIERQKRHPEERATVAYEIAGLLSTNFAHSLQENDPYLRVLDLAGELELPEHQRSSATWEDIERLVEELS